MSRNRIWIFGVAVVAVIVVAFGWLFAISPTLAQAELASTQAQSADAQNASQRIALVKLKSQYDKLSELKSELSTLQLAVPATANLDDFLDQLQQMAQTSGVTISGFTAAEAVKYGGEEGAAVEPKPAATGEPTPAADPATSAATAPAAGVKDKLFSVPITIAVKGNPDQVMAFTNAIQNGTRLLLVTGDGFTGSRDNPGDDGGTVTGFVFVARDTPAAAVPAK
ncbi:MAG: hypothetical protein ABI053_08900 [Lacisediminihabitans sp.]